MSDEEYDDELPPISVSTSRDSSEWVMPSAGAVASEREREQATERELLLLRQHSETAPPVHSDSSGSESEAALAAAVTAMQVQNAAPPAVETSLSASDFLAAVIAIVPYSDTEILTRYLAGMRLRTDNDIKAVTEQMIRRVVSLSSCEGNAWDERAVVCTAVALLAGALARARGARRALHTLLDTHGTMEHAQVCGNLVCEAITEPHVRVRISDAARSGARGGADQLADHIVYRTLRQLLPPVDTNSPESQQEKDEDKEVVLQRILEQGGNAWRSLNGARRYTVLQLCGRALAAGGTQGQGRPALRALAALTQSAAQDKHRPDHLKVVVGAAKLQLMFRTES